MATRVRISPICRGMSSIISCVSCVYIANSPARAVGIIYYVNYCTIDPGRLYTSLSNNRILPNKYRHNRPSPYIYILIYYMLLWYACTQREEKFYFEVPHDLYTHYGKPSPRISFPLSSEGFVVDETAWTSRFNVLLWPLFRLFLFGFVFFRETRLYGHPNVLRERRTRPCDGDDDDDV